MRKQYFAVMYLLILSIGTILSLYIPKNEVTAKEEVIIPSDAIRLRILANSDSESDQALKRQVRDAVNKEITKWVANLTSKAEARKLLQAKLPEIKTIAEQVVAENQSTQTVQVDFSKVQFPTKLYGQFLYPAGKYDAILITLGQGKGANWWCVLYPPLCFLDFSNGVAVSEGHEEKQVENQEQPTEKVAAANQDQNEQKVATKEEEQTITKEAIPHQDQEIKPETMPKQKEKDILLEKKANPKVERENTKQPVYTEKDEQPVQVKFFVVELWKSIF